jgi:DnaJ-class molecular chaperone
MLTYVDAMRNYSIRPRDDGRAARRVLAIPVARRNAWFSDEIAIDFPSLHAAVERMCESFVAASTEDDRRRRLSAELHLSPREAFTGVTVPLTVPVRKVCVACGGRGEVWSDPCEPCDGTGEALARHAVRLVVPPRVHDGDRFSLSVSAPSAPLTRVEVRVVLS